ncbi:chloride channel protein, CIC family [Limimonas halophila]|uniref:Chloride channel protein, CIC family n=1 Tax=Limimonas halophila TaxID=1082479 RepID=A0A1G7TFR4_9PROT|nr:chloride channel protein [Limimonas halophila]SDG34075.1 chloride channel protein, CIC family [Limimonas halophila]
MTTATETPTEPATSSRPRAKPIQLTLVQLCALSIGLGIVTGIGAVIFRLLIGLIHNLFFFGELSLVFESEELMPLSPWGPWVILVPVIGGLGVTWLTRTFAPEARGHGVPEVMDAIYHREGNVRPVVAAAKSMASALSIGTGAAVGREGPIIQIGSSFGSSFGQLLRVVTWQRITLIAAGAGAGIAATFNTPLGGVLFAIELMLPEVSSRTFLPVVLATTTATYIGRLAFGMQNAFVVSLPAASQAGVINIPTIAGFILLGLACGLVSFAFIRVLSFMEETFERAFRNDYVRHTVGMLIVGGLMYAVSQLYGHYLIAGTSYGTITALLHGELAGVTIMALLLVAKLVATTVSLGSGASGGIFSPSLFFGATLGAAMGGALNLLWPGAGFSPVEFAMVGMAGVVGGGTGAAMTAIVMVFEMTQDYVIIVPTVMATALAIGVRRWLSDENIYTIKLAWRGKHIPKERHTNMFLVRHADEIMETEFITIPSHVRLDKVLSDLSEHTSKRYILVADDDTVRGVMPVDDVVRLCHGVSDDFTLGQLANTAHAWCGATEILHDVLKRMVNENVPYALVVTDDRVDSPDAGSVVGIVDKDHIADSVMHHFKT